MDDAKRRRKKQSSSRKLLAKSNVSNSVFFLPSLSRLVFQKVFAERDMRRTAERVFGRHVTIEMSPFLIELRISNC